MNDRPAILVIMGVSGVGKTTLARELSTRLGWPFAEGDALHPPENVAKMRSGQPLDDDDREPWLDAVASWINQRRAASEPGIITCSALKQTYRRRILVEPAPRTEVRLIYLRGAHDLIAGRLAERQGHFMPASLLASQLDTLEEPTPDEPAITVDAALPPDEIADLVLAYLLPSSGDEPG